MKDIEEIEATDIVVIVQKEETFRTGKENFVPIQEEKKDSYNEIKIGWENLVSYLIKEDYEQKNINFRIESTEGG